MLCVCELRTIFYEMARLSAFITKAMLMSSLLCVSISGESRIIFLPERSSICQYPPKISAINIKKQSRARLLLAHPVLYILKIQKTYGTF